MDESVLASALAEGDIEVLGRMPWSSNATFMGRICGGEGGEMLVVYKPQRGERPLWDFPQGTLAAREVAAFHVSQATGWAIVPATILRDGPLGPGSVQRFVDHDPDDHYFELRDAHPGRFRQFAAFDVVINNADRKAGHCLVDAAGHVWGIDHGVSFHRDHKLRTIIWDHAGEPLPDDVVDALTALDEAIGDELGERLGALLADDEVEATRRRARRLLQDGVFPLPRGDYPYPWPLV